MTDDKLMSMAEGAALIGAPEAIPTKAPLGVPVSWVSADERERSIGGRFTKDTAKHELNVLHEKGLYRHLRFTSNPNGYGEYWFDLVTWPGCLTIRGDYGDAYTFSRLPDMFEFFRSKRGGINPHYWSEKLDGGRTAAKEYSEDLFRQLVVEHFVDSVRWGETPHGLGKEIRAEILNQDLADEHEARALLESFEFKGFEFHDVWEWNFHDYDWSFLWACHAIVWGIAQYDAARKPEAVAS